MMGYAKLRAGHGADIMAASRAGPNALVLSDFDDIGSALRTAVALAYADSVAETSMRQLLPGLPRATARIVEHYLRNGRRNMAVSEVAATLGLTRQTLSRRLTDAGLPPPATLMSWCRLMHAGHLLENRDRSVEQVAHEVDLGSASALRNMLRNYTGLLPREVREQGGLACITSIFQAKHRSASLSVQGVAPTRAAARAA